MAEVAEIIAFWFGKTEDDDYGKERKFWFSKDPVFDQEARSRFLSTYEKATKGELDHWQNSPESCLALILLLDQFPRNFFRNDPKAFATDEKALTIAKQALKQGFDRQLLPIQRWFIYLPFEHSENLADQHRAVELFSTIKDDPDTASALNYAHRHSEVIERFGRFPHRNEILGRPSTPAERDFLTQPGSSF